MKKKILALSILVLIIVACFIPVTQEETIYINAPFLNLYRQLITPANWARWRPDINKYFSADSSKVAVKKGSSSFAIQFGNQSLDVGFNESTFAINDALKDGAVQYSYTLIPDKDLRKTAVVVSKNTVAIKFLLTGIQPATFSNTHINDLKRFMEIDSLHYGFNIFKAKVPEANLIEIKKEVLTKDEFTEAAKMLTSLQRYIKVHNMIKTQPLIAQFLPLGKDSTHINVGFYVNKESKTQGDVIFARMPKGGPLYSIIYRGGFNKRSKAYSVLHQYFNDHLYQLSILPFESYLDDRLPASDTDRVSIRVNFATYF